MTQKDAQASDDVVKGTILVSNAPSRCLFDCGSTHSFVALHFAPKLRVAPTLMEVGLSIATPISDSLDSLDAWASGPTSLITHIAFIVVAH